MPQKNIDGKTIEVTEEGYLTDPSLWTKEMAVELAREAGIELSDKHFQVIDMLREKQLSGASLSIRRIGKSGIVTIKEFYDLFPGGPLKVSSKIAGIPKPASCV